MKQVFFDLSNEAGLIKVCCQLVLAKTRKRNYTRPETWFVPSDERDLYLPYPPIHIKLDCFAPERVNYIIYPLDERDLELEAELALDQIEYSSLIEEEGARIPNPQAATVRPGQEEFEELAELPNTSLKLDKYQIGDTPFRLLVFNGSQALLDIWQQADPQAFIWLHQQHLDRRTPFASISKALEALEKARRRHTFAELELPKLVQRRGGLWQTLDHSWEITLLDRQFTIKNWDLDIKEGHVPSLQEARLRIYLWERKYSLPETDLITGVRLRFGPGDDQLELVSSVQDD